MSLSPNQNERLTARMQQDAAERQARFERDDYAEAYLRRPADHRKAATITLAVCIVAFMAVCAGCAGWRYLINHFLSPQ